MITKTAGETRKLGAKIGEGLRGGSVVALLGNLGSGKTTFASGMIGYFTEKTRILSPTYNIVRHYSPKEKNGPIKHIFHLDLYRLKSPSEVLNLGVWDLVGQSDTLVVVEWPEIILDLLPKNRIEIHFETKEESKREVEII